MTTATEPPPTIDAYLLAFALAIGVPKIGQRHPARKFGEMAHLKGLGADVAATLYLIDHPPAPPPTPTVFDIPTLGIPREELYRMLTPPQLFRRGRVKEDGIMYDGRRWCCLGRDAEGARFTLWNLVTLDAWPVGCASMPNLPESWSQRDRRGGMPNMDAPAGLRVLGPNEDVWVVGSACIVVKGETE